ncbi:RING finger protein 225 isoform X2 [Lissotriton helveticus]
MFPNVSNDRRLKVMMSPCPSPETGSMTADEEQHQQAEDGEQSHSEELHQQQAGQQLNQQADDEHAEQLQHHQADDQQAEQHHQQPADYEQRARPHPQTDDQQAGQQNHPMANGEQSAEQPQQRADDTDSTGDSAECIICFTGYDGIFKLPKLLRCGHTFCLECLARINVSSEVVTSLNCPICRNITRLPARRGLPALDNNQDILEQLPQELRPTRSVRFSRKKGLLYVKNAPSPQSPLPKSLQLSTVSLSLDVGRPPPRVRIPRNFGRGSWLFYATVAIAILLTIAVVMVGVYIFFIVPTSSSVPSNSSIPGNWLTNSNHMSAPPNNNTVSQTPDVNITRR